MRDPVPCRVIVDLNPASGAWNMAVDEVLLESALERAVCTLRWYRWDVPTLSLGYFQSRASALHEPRFAGMPIVRRLTGGGAIVHHHELTYSCALAPVHPLAANPRRLYSLVHECAVAVLAGFGVEARLRGETHAERESEFLCFSRGDPHDVVMQHGKVLGSAQRRRKGAVLQHGSLVLRRSPKAVEFAGIFDFGAPEADSDELAGRLAAAISRLISPDPVPGELTPAEWQRATCLSRTYMQPFDETELRAEPV